MKLNSDWKEFLSEEFKKAYFLELKQFVNDAYASEKNVYPPKSLIFNAFNACPVKKTRVVILGQDPYHKQGQADGKSFSVPPGVKFPPSLRNILLELQNDVGKEIPFTGSLSDWANQGVLLLNATLTVEEASPTSHQNRGWEIFSDNVIQKISQQKENVVFLLWGNFARKKKKLIDLDRHLVLESGHPSPMSANRGLWFGNKHFSECNRYLASKNKVPISW